VLLVQTLQMALPRLHDGELGRRFADLRGELPAASRLSGSRGRAGSSLSDEEDRRYDVIARSGAGLGDDYAQRFGMDIVKCLAKKGFCVIKSTVREEAAELVLKEISDLRREFEPPPDEVVEGLLGAEGSQRVLELPSLASDAPGSVLAVLDEYMNDLAGSIGPMVPALGFEVRTRTPLMIHESSTARDDFPEVEQEDAARWLQTFSLARIMCLGFVGPGRGTLMLRPHGDEECGQHVIDTEPGMWVILRADVLEHIFGSEMYRTYVLSCWLLESYGSTGLGRRSRSFPMSPAARVLEDFLRTAPASEDEESTNLRRFRPKCLEDKGLRIAVRGAACQLPTGLHLHSAWPVMNQGVDCVEELQLHRWDHSLFYDVDPENIRLGRIACRHAAFLEGLELFDNKLFGVSPGEAKTLAPEQRKTLEVAHEALHDAGFTDIKSMFRTSTGVYVGATWSEFNLIQPGDSIEQGAYGTTSNMTPLLANRVSYCFGLQGPSECLDTEGSSSLVAACRAADTLDPEFIAPGVQLQNEKSLCLGVSLVLAPAFMLMPARAGLLSSTGRCSSFDASADGYICGDGCGAILLAPHSKKEKASGEDNDDLLRGIFNACRIVNVGTTALMNVPSGRSDVSLLKGALEKARMSPSDVDMIECNASGSLLGDAIEVAAIVNALCTKGPHETGLVLSASKTSFANMRTCAGIGGLMKALVSLAFGTPPPDCHLNVINPHFQNITDDQEVLFLSETLRLSGSVSCCGVTSKGFGGTSAHVLVSASIDAEHLPTRATDVHFLPIVHWPGGGGELDDGAHPEKGYAIIGSWSSWTTAVFMKEEAAGVFEYTVTLGEHRLEKFLILIDGQSDRVLHPSDPASATDTRAYGPSLAAEGLGWAIDARGLPGNEWQSFFGDGLGEPGDQYRVRLSVAGKWRSVSWERVQSGPTASPEPARYFLSASWNEMGLEEMHEDPNAPGVFHHEVRLIRPGGQFLVVVNKDQAQLLHPSPFSNIALGPDPEEVTEGVKWLLDGLPGDVYKISLSIAAEGGSLSKSVAWEKLRNEPLTAEELQNMHRLRYYIAGTWNNWLRMHEMSWGGDSYHFSLELGAAGEESFQILLEGQTSHAVHPLVANASFHENPRVQTGPYGEHLHWTIGRHPLDQGAPGQWYKVKLHVMSKVDGKIPNRVEWVRLVNLPGTDCEMAAGESE